MSAAPFQQPIQLLPDTGVTMPHQSPTSSRRPSALDIISSALSPSSKGPVIHVYLSTYNPNNIAPDTAHRPSACFSNPVGRSDTSRHWGNWRSGHTRRTHRCEHGLGDGVGGEVLGRKHSWRVGWLVGGEELAIGDGAGEAAGCRRLGNWSIHKIIGLWGCWFLKQDIWKSRGHTANCLK